jgi:nucleotide-binding universal stress UspA family protein
MVAKRNIKCMTFDPVFSCILVAYDGSEPSKKALDIAARTAAIFKGELIILTVVPPATLPLATSDLYPSSPSVAYQIDYDTKMKELYQKSLDEAENHVSEIYAGLKVEKVLKNGRPSAIIVEEGENRNVSLIVMGSRGLGGITGWILGSTSRRVVDSCTKPILIVK